MVGHDRRGVIQTMNPVYGPPAPWWVTFSGIWHSMPISQLDHLDLLWWIRD